MTKRWIQKATKSSKGSLRTFAKRHRLMTKRGTIDLPRARKYVLRNLKGATRTRRIRQLNLAKTLRKF